MNDQNDVKTTEGRRGSRDGKSHSTSAPSSKDGAGERRDRHRSGSPVRPMSRRLIGAILFGLVVFSVGASVGFFYAPQLAAVLPMGHASSSAVSSEGHMHLLEGRIRTLESRSEQQVSVITGISNDYDRVRDDLAKVRAELENVGKRITDADVLSERIDSLDGVVTGPSIRADILGLMERLERLEARSSPDLDMEDYRLLITKDDLDVLSNSVRITQDRILALESEAELRRVGQLAFALSVSELRKAIGTEKPYTADLEAVRVFSQDLDGLIAPEVEEALQALEFYAVEGIPTLVTLRQKFASLAGEIVQNADRGDEVDWLDQTLSRLTSIVSVRRTGEVIGQSIEARVARAELRLEAGQLAAAAGEIRNLQGVPKRIASKWLADAESRLAAERALEHLNNYVLSGLGQRVEPE